MKDRELTEHEMKQAKKYFHEIPQSEIEQLKADKKTWGYITDNYKQPDWCRMKNALSGLGGCWSLIDIKKGGARTKISRDNCKICAFCSVDCTTEHEEVLAFGGLE